MSASLSSLLAELLAADEEYDAAEREWDLLGPDGLGERDTRSANCPEFERYMVASSRRHDAMKAAQSRPEAELPDLPIPSLVGYADLSETYLRSDHFTADQMRAYGQQCASTRPGNAESLANARGGVADADRLDWLETHPGFVWRSYGYLGDVDAWSCKDAKGVTRDFTSFRDAVSFAMKAEAPAPGSEAGS